jgi:hypothetical protein
MMYILCLAKHKLNTIKCFAAQQTKSNILCSADSNDNHIFMNYLLLFITTYIYTVYQCSQFYVLFTLSSQICIRFVIFRYVI